MANTFTTQEGAVFDALTSISYRGTMVPVPQAT